MEDATFFWSPDRVEALVLSLYESKTPEMIATDQALLADFQSLPQAWSLAHELLRRSDEKVRFFGALTIIIKLNRESNSLGEEHAKELLMHLMGWYLDSFRTSNSPLVPRKLSSALATFFIHFHHLWPNSVRHLVACFVSRHYHEPLNLHAVNEASTRLQHVETDHLRAVLWVITSVLEDVAKIDLNTINNFGLYEAVVCQAPDVAHVISECLADHHLSATGDDAMRCLQAWLTFAQKISSRDSQVIALFRNLLPRIMAFLPVDSQFESAAELLIEILAGYPSLLTTHHLDLLTDLMASSWSDERYARLMQGDGGFDAAQFGQLILSFGEERRQWLMEGNDSRCQAILSKLCGLLAAKGQPVIEDKIFVPAIEFWSSFTEAFSDSLNSGDVAATPGAQQAVKLVLEAISNAWRKVMYPSIEEVSDWDEADRASFCDARKDVVDLLQSTYTLCGPRLVATFAQLVLEALHDRAWLHLEAAAFCLAGLADCGREDGKLDEALRSVFSSCLFETLKSSNSDIPQRTKQTCLYLIEQYTDYFERNILSLAPALGLLFHLLEDKCLASTASKSILQLCSSCRHHLHPEAESFLAEYQKLASFGQLDCMSSERVIGAVACVAQAIPSGNRRNHVWSSLLSCVEDDVFRAKELVEKVIGFKLPCSGQRCHDNTANERPSLHIVLKALRCLLSVGRGSQSPTESAIDLDNISSMSTERDPQLALLHRHIMGIMVDVEAHFCENTEVLELNCAILRCGFAESEPGPFVLDIDTVTRYLTGHTGALPRPGLLVTTACAFVSSLDTQGSASKENVFAALFSWVVELLRALQEPENDPELSQNGIEFASRLLIKSPDTLLARVPQATAEFFFLFSIQVLDGNEPLPKGAAAEFWSNFIALKNCEPETLDAAKQAMETLGPLVARSIARNLGGRASRSELDRLAEPIKKLVNRHPMARQWLEAGLSHDSFPSNNITLEQKSLFVKRLVSLRGSRATNKIVREFWLSARGSSFAYAS